jgi:AcrR family transcriptional regulator
MRKSPTAKRSYNTGLRQQQAKLTRNRILDAASRLFVDRGYSNVTVEDIAREAGVAQQTVYAVFGTKLAVAQAIIWSSFETEGILPLMEHARESGDLEVHIRTGARMARLLNERFATIVRFMRESGDPALLAEYHKIEGLRFEQISAQLSPVLKRTKRLRPGLSHDGVVGSIWAMLGTDLYNQLVTGRGWPPSRYEKWLTDALVSMVLQPSNKGEGA